MLYNPGLTHIFIHSILSQHPTSLFQCMALEWELLTLGMFNETTLPVKTGSHSMTAFCVANRDDC